MSSNNNFNYNPYRYPAVENDEDLTSQFSTSRQPPLPNQGYGDPTYDWRIQTSSGTSGLSNHQLMNNRNSYSASQDVYSHSQGFPSHHSGDLPSVTSPLNYPTSTTARQQDPRTLENSGLNSLVYVSALESAILKNPAGQSEAPVKPIEDNVRNGSFRSRSKATPPSYSARSTYQFKNSQQPQQSNRSTPVTSSSSVPPFTSSSHQQYSTYRSPVSSNSQPSMTSTKQAANNAHSYNTNNYQRPETFNRLPDRSSPLNIQATPNTASSNYPMAPNQNSTATTNQRDSPGLSNSQQFNQQSFPTSSTSTPLVTASTGTMRDLQILSPPQPVMTHKFPSGSPGNRIDVTLTESKDLLEQTSPPRVQYINPNELYIQQYRQEQELVRAAEAQAAVKKQKEEHKKQQKQEKQEQQAKAKAASSAQRRPSKKQGPTSDRQLSPSEINRSVSASAQAEEEKEDDMASEMRAMLEKLRGMRSKDPSLFANIWDGFRKDQTVNQTASKSPAQGEQQSAESGPAPTPADPVTTVTPTSHKVKVDTMLNATPSASPAVPNATPDAMTMATPQLAAVASVHLAQQSETLQNSPGRIDGLPDLGRFPAQRRRRGPRTSNNIEANRTNNKAGVQAGPAPPSATSTPTTSTNEIQAGQSPPVLNMPNVPKAATPVPHPQSDTPGQPALQRVTQNRASEGSRPTATQQKLARSTLEYLMKNPANKGKTGIQEALIALLRSNPSYPELCQQLESRGFALDRQVMARYLLAAVPALSSNDTSQGQKKPEPNIDAASQSRPQALQASHLLHTWSPSVNQPAPVPQPAAREVIMWDSKIAHPASITKLLKTTPSRLTQDSASNALANSISSSSQQDPPAHAKAVSRPSKLPTSKTSSSGPIQTSAPSTKEAAARKRFFSDIVDLSQLSDDEGLYPTLKQPRLEGGSTNGMSGQSDSTMNHAQPGEVLHPRGPPNGFNQMAAGDFLLRQPHIGMEKPTSAVPENPRLDVSRFELATSDELLREATRRRPDIINPMKDSVALNRGYYNPKTIARDILIAAGRHPTERPLNYHLLKLQDTFLTVSSKSDLETFRWDLVDLGGPPMPIVQPEDILAFPPTLQRKHRQDKQSRDPTGAGSGDKTPPHASLPSNQTSQQPPLNSSHITPTNAGRSIMVGDPSSDSVRRRGRPPGSKNKNFTKASFKLNTKIEVAIPTGPPVPDPSYPVFQCEWQNCPAQLHDLQTLVTHAHKLHVSGQTSCLWHGCPNSGRRYNGLELRKHLELAHIKPLAWKFGDGPSIKETVIDSDRYLNDLSGAAITPNAAIMGGEADSIIFPVNHTPLRAYNRLHGNSSAVEKAKQVLKAVQNHRRKVGFGLEQGGCELANPARNAVLNNDEEIFEQVSDNE